MKRQNLVELPNEFYLDIEIQNQLRTDAKKYVTSPQPYSDEKWSKPRPSNFAQQTSVENVVIFCFYFNFLFR